MYLVAVFIIFIITASIPFIISQLQRSVLTIKLYDSLWWLPAVAAVLFILAFYIPDIHISNQTTTFQQHFVGGGFYVAVLYVYFKQLFGWKLRWYASLVVLFAWASAFGVANELLEFALTQLKLAHIGTGDTDWDLLANTVGAFTGYGLLLLTKLER